MFSFPKLFSCLFFIFSFALRYFENNPAPFEEISIDAESGSKKFKLSDLRSNIPKVLDIDIVLACYNILQSAPYHFKSKWNWSKFYKYLMSGEENTRW